MKYAELERLFHLAKKAEGEERERLLHKHHKLRGLIERLHRAEGDARERLMEKIMEEMPRLAEEIMGTVEELL